MNESPNQAYVQLEPGSLLPANWAPPVNVANPATANPLSDAFLPASTESLPALFILRRARGAGRRRGARITVHVASCDAVKLHDEGTKTISPILAALRGLRLCSKCQDMPPARNWGAVPVAGVAA